MRFVFVNRYFHPDASASSQFLADLAFHLRAADHDVRVVTSNVRRDAPDETLPPSEKVLDVAVTRLAGGRMDREQLLVRSFDSAPFYRNVRQHLVEHLRKDDVLVVLSDPPLLSTVCQKVVRKQEARLVHWLLELQPEVALQAGARVPGPVATLLRKVRDRSLQQADANVAVSETMARRLREAGVPDARIEVIGPWGLATIDRAGATAATALRTDWDLEGRFVVGYAGSLGPTHDSESLLSGIEKTAGSKNRDLAWLFVGGDAGINAMRESVPMRAIDMVKFRDALPLHRLAEVMAVPDVHLVCQLPEMEGLAFPGKLAGILAAGKPLIFIGDKEGEIGTMIDREGCGMAIQSGDAEGLAAAIAQMHAIPESRADMGRRARALYERRFAREPALAAWTGLLTSLGPG
ncbi:MAG: glycosyltransferase family 4 protein [Gammaproteobacteria bacterium]|nr:glycosyltransferase family 4 protein [Gammaproteobacteria bacterium]